MTVAIADAQKIVAGLLRNGRVGDAVVAANQLLHLAPRDVGSLRLVAEARLAAGDPTSARDPVRRARAVDPHCPRLMALEARTLADATDPAPARRLFEAALEAAPDDLDIRAAALSFLLRAGDLAAAARTADPLVAAVRDGSVVDPALVEVVAATAEAVGAHAIATEFWQGMADRHPELANGHLGLARAAKRVGLDGRALEHAEAALMASPGDVQVLAETTAAALEAGNGQRTEELLERLETLLPDHPVPHRLAARIAARAGDSAGAARRLVRAVACEGDDATTALALADALGRCGRWSESARVLDTLAADLRPRLVHARLAQWRPMRLAAALGAGEDAPWRWLCGDAAGQIEGAIDGADLLVTAPRDIRATLVLSRWLPALRRRAARVTLAVDARLVSLAGRFAGVDAVVSALPEDGGGPRVEMVALPAILDPDPASRPALDAARVAAWRRDLTAQAGGPLIGVVWDGPLPVVDLPFPRERLSLLSALARSRGTPVSGQWGLAPEAARALAILPAADRAADFDGLLHLLAALDHVVGVDGASLHLAALAGTPATLAGDLAVSWWWRVPGLTGIDVSPSAGIGAAVTAGRAA